jgi:hypothetical protein
LEDKEMKNTPSMIAELEDKEMKTHTLILLAKK